MTRIRLTRVRISVTIGTFPGSTCVGPLSNSVTNSTLMFTHSDSCVKSGEAGAAKSVAGDERAGGCIGVFLLDDHEVVRRGLRDILMAAGAAGYVMKTSGSAELIGAIRATASGMSMIDPRAAQEVIERLRNQTVTIAAHAFSSAETPR